MRPAALHRLLRFALVGGIGFAIDGGLLTLLLAQGQAVLPSRLLSFAAAVTATWALNRSWTFAAIRRADKGREYLGYFSVQIVGAGINLGCFFLCLALLPGLRSQPLLPLLVGAVPALAFNYLASRRLVFRGPAGPAP